MRGQPAVTDNIVGSEELFGAETLSRLPPPGHSRFRPACCANSALIHDPGFMSTDVDLKRCPLMAPERRRASSRAYPFAGTHGSAGLFQQRRNASAEKFWITENMPIWLYRNSAGHSFMVVQSEW